MPLLFLTADKIGTFTGGGLVTSQENLAMWELDNTFLTMGRDDLQGGSDPWGWDQVACKRLKEWDWKYNPIKLCHIYSGSFSDTVTFLKSRGTKVTYTIAAHDKEISRREHEKLGFPFPYPHLVDEQLWNRYIEGYRLADVIITPGSVPERTVKNYNSAFQDKVYKRIPHGVHLPKETSSFPTRFTVGYLGSYGADKGVKYLLEAWKKLNYKDSVLLLGGRDSTSSWMRNFITTYGGGNISCIGWVYDTSDFYSKISLYVQPSATEGFGLEVIEAMAHGRPVLCSHGAGAVDVVNHLGQTFLSCNVDDLCNAINSMRQPNKLEWYARYNSTEALKYTWDKTREKYKEIWKELL